MICYNFNIISSFVFKISCFYRVKFVYVVATLNHTTLILKIEKKYLNFFFFYYCDM